MVNYILLCHRHHTDLGWAEWFWHNISSFIRNGVLLTLANVDINENNISKTFSRVFSHSKDHLILWCKWCYNLKWGLALRKQNEAREIKQIGIKEKGI